MKTYCGISVFNGIAIGKVCLYQKGDQHIMLYKLDDPQQ